MILCSGIPGVPCPRENAPAVVKGRCRTCQYRFKRQTETGGFTPRDAANMVPVLPLINALDHALDKSGLDLAAWMGLPFDSPEYTRVYSLMQRVGGDTSVFIADDICCKYLKVHPCAVYGELWWDLSEQASKGFTEEIAEAA